MLEAFQHSGVQISEHDPHAPLEQFYCTSAMNLRKYHILGSSFASNDENLLSTNLQGKSCYISDSKDARYASSEQGINLKKEEDILLALLTKNTQQWIYRVPNIEQVTNVINIYHTIQNYTSN